MTEVTEGLLEIKVYLMPAEQFKSTLTRACWCKLLNCSGARFLRNFAKKPCTLKRITFWFFLKSGDNQWILTVKTKVLTHKIEILTRFYIIAFANAIIQQTLFKAIKFRIWKAETEGHKKAFCFGLFYVFSENFKKGIDKVYTSCYDVLCK